MSLNHLVDQQGSEMLNFIYLLNDDIHRLILSFLPITSLMSLQLVSKNLKFFSLSTCDDFLWKNFYFTKVNEMREACKDSHYVLDSKTNVYTVGSIHGAKISEFLNVESEFRRNLVKLLEMFMRKADDDYKRRTRDIENIRGVKKNSIFYTRQQIMDYQIPKMDKIDNSDITHIKAVQVGDNGIGKTCMLITVLTSEYPKDYIPTILDNFTQNITVNDQIYSINMWDSGMLFNIKFKSIECELIAGPDERLRVLTYPQTNLFLLSYNCSSEKSFMNIIKWIPELRHHCPETSIILVATKIDIREDAILRRQFMIKNETKPIGYEQGEMMARKMGCLTFIETSSKNLIGLNDLLEFIVKCCVVSGDENYARTQIGLKRDKKNCEMQ